MKTRTGKVLQEELGHRHITVTPFPEEPLPSPVKPGKARRSHKYEPRQGPSRGLLSTPGLPAVKWQIKHDANKRLSLLARVLQVLDESKKRTDNPRKLWYLKSSSYVRSTPNQGPTGRLRPNQAPPAGVKLNRALRLLSPLLKAVLSHVCLNYLDAKPLSRISRENIFPPSNESLLWRILIFPNKYFPNNNDVFSVCCVGAMGFGSLRACA